MDLADTGMLRQHLIDPEICIRCNTCEATCPIDAITHDDNNYVVDAEKCDHCMDCISPCPTGSIDNWRIVPRQKAYSLEEQLGWEELPEETAVEGESAPDDAALISAQTMPAATLTDAVFNAASLNATMPPWSAAHAYTNLYGPKTRNDFVTATVAGNVRVTEVGKDYDTHHLVLDFGSLPFPVLEGQSIGIIPPGLDHQGKPHHARQYSVASPRNGERPGYNNLSLTIKRVLEDHQGNPVRGIASNYLCDLSVGDQLQVIGPFGTSFLMPNHPGSHLVMICTGTGSAPMRAMTEWRRRLRRSGKFRSGKMMLFFGARTQEELPYFGPLTNLPKDFIDINLAFSRTPGAPRRYVQDCIRNRATDVAAMLSDPETYFYICGLKAMEEGVLLALRDVATQAGLDWETLAGKLRDGARLHLETY